jgi:hypothetical protein
MSKQDRWASDDVLETFRKPTYVELEVEHGMKLTHTGSRFTGVVSGFSERDQVLLVGDSGDRQLFKAHDGAFTHKGIRVALRAPETRADTPRRFTASGSIEVADVRARVAAASRIWVEGIHDAELIEKIWGDDLRVAGVVVEPLHGADDLETAVAEFGPASNRKLGVLLDHLIEGSKESRMARRIEQEHILVRGHPYVDIWQAIKPGTIGIAAWPEVPVGQSWKGGVVRGLGMDVDTGVFWGKVLNAVSSYRDVETPLVNAVEQLIDFVTVEG